MPDKMRERYYLEALRRAIGELPDGEVFDPDPPDFVIHGRDKRLGIEITVFHLPAIPGKRPHQEQQSLRERVVALAERNHRESGGPALYVSVFFQDEPALRKHAIQPLAHAIANAVLSVKAPTSIEDPMVQLPWDSLPNGITHIHLHGSVDGEDRHWHPAAGGWVAQIIPSQVAHVIEKKAEREALARTRCDELWLVVVNDPFSRAAPAELPPAALDYEYNHPFDRLIWLLPHAPRAFELRKKTATG